MKKMLISIILAITCGFIFGMFFLKKFDQQSQIAVSTLKTQAYAFQIGVFKNKENALNFAAANSGMVVNDEDLYRVYTVILNNESIINRVKNYYQTNNINFYLKAVNISNDATNTINNYEMLLEKTEDSNFELILKKLTEELSSGKI